jgi:crossover junction endonuclease EME1
MKVAFPEGTLIYMIEGLDQWFRKNKTARNRQFQNAARNDINPSGAQARRRNTGHEIVDEDIVEDAILSLQVDHGVLIHKTNAAVETAQWITVFTQHISTIPYRKLRDDISTDAGFSVESGQVKTGETVKETYVLMLQEVARVTAPMAYGIAAEYPAVIDLVRGLERVGPFALEDLRKSANKDGRLTDQRIGQAVSKRLYKIFTCRDPTSTDI